MAEAFQRAVSVALLCVTFPALCAGPSPELQPMNAGPPLVKFTVTGDASRAAVRVHAATAVGPPVPKLLTGKFAEHLGANIYGGMCAQILVNPTFAEWWFHNGRHTPDGMPYFLDDSDRVAEHVRRLGECRGYPESDREALVRSYRDGLAAGWMRVGPADQVRVSPDVARKGGRAQRIETKDRDQGLAQWTWLPLHRTRRYEFEFLARATKETKLTLRLAGERGEVAAECPLAAFGNEWRRQKLGFELPADLAADRPCRLSLLADGPANFVVARALLWPADHVGGSDPDVIRMLKESGLPLLRWPGGNFVSGYRWEGGIGPVDDRPVYPNWAWGGIEPNLFGTHEFIGFCRAVGCEPMICVNGGNGTPEEAARWVEYCNGPVSSPMGARRAANGQPEPFNVRHWEVGNELWGRWQVSWTTPEGHVDRYRRFVAAMRAADPSIKLYACGAPVHWGKEWNLALFRSVPELIECTTDHPLLGAQVKPDLEPLDVYRDFMAFPVAMEKLWREMRDQMSAAGIKAPRMAITELQLFARLHAPRDFKGPDRLTGKLVNPATHAEALYDILYYHLALRMAPFVAFITHSATVNHGGGLRKERERVYGNPCHYAQSLFSAFSGAQPVAVEVEAATERAPLVLSDLRNAAGESLAVSAIDTVAARSPDGQSLLISIVNRRTAGVLKLSLIVDGAKPAGEADVRTLAADVPWAANTPAEPGKIKPVASAIAVRDGKIELAVQPFSYVLVRIPLRTGEGASGVAGGNH
jgi:alpha-N-arabinofuranosidase